MTFNKIKNTLNKFAQNEQIIRKHNGSYYINNIYKITNINGLWEVYKTEYYINSFESSATATSWCFADKAGWIMDANNLIIIDHKLQLRKNSIHVQTKFLNQTELPSFQHDAILSRIFEDVNTCKCIKQEINKNYLERINILNLQDFKL